ncbi:MAG: FecR family protein [Calditrichota bacterium]
MMLKRSVILLFFFLSTTISAQEVAKVTFPLNRVFIIPAGSNTLDYATFNSTINAGDIVQTRSKSRCELLLSGGETIRLDGNTTFSIEKADGEIRCLLSVGKIWVAKPDGGEPMRVITPSSEVLTDSSEFRLDAGADGVSIVFVYSGSVESRASLSDAVSLVELSAKRDPVMLGNDSLLTKTTAGKRLTRSLDGEIAIADFDQDSDELEDWVNWNRRRDRLIGEQRRRDNERREYRARGN